MCAGIEGLTVFIIFRIFYERAGALFEADQISELALVYNAYSSFSCSEGVCMMHCLCGSLN